MSDLQAALADIQKNLNAPKSQFNSFGKYNYRNCEDILMAVKPLLGQCVILVSDDVVAVSDRIYVKATATIKLGNEELSATAFARESLTKKGMDDSQITGSASSYARKYALNGLLLIDDNKDADSQQPTSSGVTLEQLQKHITDNNFTVESICQSYNVQSLNQLTDFKAVMNQITQWSKQ